MPSFGEKLKKERETRSITLEQISVSTKIGTRMLQALEADKFNQLPGGIFNKGFVRAYARCLGIDEEQAVADYLEASGEVAPARPEMAPESTLAASIAPPHSRGVPWSVFAVILLIVAIGLSIWNYREQEHREHPAAAHVAAASGKPPATPSSNVYEPLPSADANPSPATISSSAATLPSGAGPTPSSVPPATSAPSAQHAALPGGFTVTIQAREDSWISVSADGTALSGDMIITGNQRSIHARKEVVIRAGNTGALDFLFNGRKLPSQGDYGEVKTLAFDSSGLVAKPPAPTATQ